MEHETIKNDFFAKSVVGPVKEIPLKEAIFIAVGYRLFMSKRLAPAGTICNGRIYTAEGEFIHSTDINVFEVADRLATVAQLYKTELFIFSESSNTYYWRSSMPTMWCGGIEVNGEWVNDRPHHFADAKDYLEISATARKRQWKLDHGFARRNPKEWFHDAWFRWRHVGTEAKFYFRQKDISVARKLYCIGCWLFCI